MSKDPKAPQASGGKEPYAEVVARLQKLVEALEGGQLPLEDALEKFGEGVQLVKKAEKLLADAEKRVEQLMSDDRVAPLEVSEAAQGTAKPAARRPATKDDEDGDVPF